MTSRAAWMNQGTFGLMVHWIAPGPAPRAGARITDLNAAVDRFDLDRDRESAGIASFGVGRHFCLGASLARLEAHIVLEELMKRVRSYDIDPAGTERVHSVNVRGFAHLPTSVEAR